MIKHRIITLVAVALLSTSVLADNAMCPQKSAKNKLNDHQPPTPQCQQVEKPCESKDVGVMNWLTDSHSMPSMHFIDFVEVFLH